MQAAAVLINTSVPASRKLPGKVFSTSRLKRRMCTPCSASRHAHDHRDLHFYVVKLLPSGKILVLIARDQQHHAEACAC